MADVQIQLMENGPIIVKGKIQLTDHTGAPIPTHKNVIALCRCGGSTTKPFCDGTHSAIGFQGAIHAVEEAEAAE